MKFRPIEDGYLVLLEKGENVLETLKKFVKEQKIPGGMISGVGAVTDATLGIFDYQKKEFVTKTFMDELEIGHLCANISYLSDSNEPFIHCHLVVSDSSLGAYAGHLMEGTVSLTLELYIKTFKEKIIRGKDPEIGFSFWQL